jgi:hypothetical protein
MMMRAAGLLLLLGALGASAAAAAAPRCNVDLYARAETEGGKLIVRDDPVPWATVRGCRESTGFARAPASARRRRLVPPPSRLLLII